jgi:hypothetical protein
MLDERGRPIRQKTSHLLTDTIVMRGGAKAKDWPYGSTDIVVASRPEDADSQPRAATLSFTLPSKGGGDTEIEVRVGPQAFPALIAFMAATDKDATLKAIAEELRYQICGPNQTIGGSRRTTNAA